MQVAIDNDIYQEAQTYAKRQGMDLARDLDIAGAAVPVTASYTINPYAHTSYLNAGVGIRF